MVVGSVLVTGGTGYIGSFTALALLEADYKVVIVDNLYNSSEEVLNRIELICGKRPEYYSLDITDEKKLDEVFEQHPDIDNVIHFAALKAVGESGEIPLEYYRVNVFGSLCLLRSMQKHNVTNIVFSSSATVYGDATRFPNMIPIPEECPLGPTNPYGNTKFGVETMITDHINAERNAAKKAGKSGNEHNAAFLRYFNPAGSHPSGIMGELYVHIVMELCSGGELFDRIIQRGHYTERKAAELTKIIVGVVEACHSLGVMHRDLKPENFLLVNKDDDFSLKAIDFGLSVFFKPDQVFTDVVGSPYYVAPEVLLKQYGPEADVWTAGVILYILLSGVPPFWAETQQGIFDAVLKGYIDFDSDPWPRISDSAKDLIRKMLCSRSSERLTAHEVLCHPWINENGVAPDRSLDPAVLSRLKQFSAMNKLKKMALRVIAESLSEEEIAGLKEMFQAIDTDNSGAITFDELKAGLRGYGSTLKDIEIRDLMDAADVDNSGTIDYGEFVAATIHLNKLEREEHLVAAFQYFDKDGSGYITVDELQQACAEHNMTDVLLEDIIKEVDQDNDGRIDYGEFVAMMQKGNAGIGRRTMRNSLNMSMRDAPGAQ